MRATRLVACIAMLGVLLPATRAAAAPTCFGKRATIVGTPGDDRLVGTTRRDVIVGRGMLPKAHFERALARMPVEAPSALHDLQGPSYLYAILTDPRISS